MPILKAIYSLFPIILVSFFFSVIPIEPQYMLHNPYMTPMATEYGCEDLRLSRLHATPSVHLHCKLSIHSEKDDP